MKKIFGELNLTWPKIIIGAILIGIYGGLVCLIPYVKESSLHDISVTFEVWILFGILIIVNSKTPKESALKCFVFFLISQPLIYLTQDILVPRNPSRLMTFYKYWLLWTIACVPMGYIGHYMKKNKWWGLLILMPMIAILTLSYTSYLPLTFYTFPYHLLTSIFCAASIIIYPIYIFDDKKIKKIGLTISILIVIVSTIFSFLNPHVYDTQILSSGEKYQFDDTYKVTIEDPSYGTLTIEPYVIKGVEGEEDEKFYVVHSIFKKMGKTTFTLESPGGEKKVFDLEIKDNTYSVDDKKN